MLKVVELFAGVGGFHVGLSRAGGYQVTWANQWEPGIKAQHAATVYQTRFPATTLVNEDIQCIDVDVVPEHDVLVGGWPCQDFSRANKGYAGMKGAKSSLWWRVDEILARHQPRYAFFENVETMLNSPGARHANRGRDFATILATLQDRGYVVEWRVVTGSDYGWPQRRARTWIAAFRHDTPEAKRVAKALQGDGALVEAGFFAEAFPCTVHERKGDLRDVPIGGEDVVLRDDFHCVWGNAGGLYNGVARTRFVEPVHEGPGRVLGDVLEAPRGPNVFVPEDTVAKWTYLKGAKDEWRTKKDGTRYPWKEGAVPFPDCIDKPARTITKTSSHGTSPDRSKIAFLDPGTGHLRVLTPVECERLQGFPDDWTLGVPTSWRHQLMGNALITWIPEVMGKQLLKWTGITATPQSVPVIRQATLFAAPAPAAPVPLAGAPGRT